MPSRVRSVVKRMQRHVVGVAQCSEMSVVPLAIGVVAIGCVIGRRCGPLHSEGKLEMR